MEAMRVPRTLARPATRRLRAAALLPAVAWVVGFAAVATGADRMASETRGSGSPTLVLIHSIGGDRSDWDPVAPALAKRHRLLLVDLPGHGRSGPPDEETVAATARALEQVLAKKKVTGAILVGHSYGALVALEAAAAAPERAAAVIAIDAATFTQADSTQVAEVEKILRERYSVFLSAIYQRMSADPVRADSLVAHAMRVKPEVLGAYFRDAWHVDLRSRIKPMKTPVHVIATPLLWPPAESWTSARARLGYETAGPAMGYRILDSAHYVTIDQPDSLVQTIERIAEQTAR